MQEALFAAARHWPSKGLPDSPRGWLYRVATRRFVDQTRSAVARRRRENAAGEPGDDDVVPAADDAPACEQDDALVLLFMCCHPALTPASAIALTRER